MRKFIDSYFTFSRRERNGVLVLLFLSIAVLLVPKIYLYFSPVKHADNSKYVAEINAFANEYNKQKTPIAIADDTTPGQATTSAIEPVNDEPKGDIAYSPFDPNKIGVAEWMKLGFTEKQAMSIEKYKAAGAVFYKPEDLKRAYAIGEEGYARLAPYIKIDAGSINSRYASVKYFAFDPNTIGVKEWMKLGFSEKQARSIEKYKATGAVFHKPEDLKKVYVIGEEGYNRLRQYIKIPRI